MKGWAEGLIITKILNNIIKSQNGAFLNRVNIDS